MKIMIKRYVAVIILLITVTIFISGYIIINANTTNWNFSMKTIMGDESVLEGIRISAKTIDNAGLMDFSLASFSGISEHSNYTFFKSQNEYYSNMRLYNSWNYHSPISSDKYDYYMYNMSLGVGYKYDISHVSIYRWGIYGNNTRELINIPIRIKSKYIDGNINYDMQGQFMVEEKDKLYFTIPTDQNCTGESGIYEVSEFYSDTDHYDEEKRKSYRMLASVPIDSTTQVIGLYAIDARLCLAIREENMIVLKLFDIQSGEFLSQISIDSNKEIYRTYSQGNSFVIMLRNTELFAFEVEDTIRQVGHLDTYSSRTVNGEDVRANKQYIRFKNNRFYVLQDVFEFNSGQIYMNIDSRPVDTLCILVFENKGDLIYYGQIETDIRDDHIRNAEYNEWLIKKRNVAYREYVDLKLE